MLKATIKIRHQKARMSTSITRSLEPDNLLAPTGLKVVTRTRGKVTTLSLIHI